MHAEWFYDFRLAIKTDLGSRDRASLGIVSAAVNEREVAGRTPEAGPGRRLGLDRRPARSLRTSSRGLASHSTPKRNSGRHHGGGQQAA